LGVARGVGVRVRVRVRVVRVEALLVTFALVFN
jgi:hypothetical protein